MTFGDFFDEPKFDFEKERKSFIDNLNLLKTMSVQEQTLYKKWQEFNADVYSMTQKASKFRRINNSIWIPTDINNKEQTIKEIESLDPYVQLLEQGNAKENETWTLVRRLIHKMEFTANPGRNMKFFVKDRTSGKLLGGICLGSDVTSLGARDKFIGWTLDNKFKDRSDNSNRFVSVIVRAKDEFIRPVTLKEIKNDKFFKELILLKQSRLSVMEINIKYWKKICKMSKIN